MVARYDVLKHYSADDVQRILSLAMDADETFSADALADMASELSIDRVALQRAIAQWQVETADSQQLAAQAFEKQQRRQRFYRQELMPYVVVNAFLLALNFAIAGAITWAIYPLLGWGLGLCLGIRSGTCRRGQAAKPRQRGTV